MLDIGPERLFRLWAEKTSSVSSTSRMKVWEARELA